MSKSQIPRREYGSTPAVGSSNIIKRACPTNAVAILNFLFIPPLSSLVVNLICYCLLRVLKFNCYFTCIRNFPHNYFINNLAIITIAIIYFEVLPPVQKSSCIGWHFVHNNSENLPNVLEGVFTNGTTE